MSIKQGQIVYHNFPIPGQDSTKLHPVLILSNSTLLTEQEMYIGVMISSSENYYGDLFCYELEDKMFSFCKLPKEKSHIRLHFITYFHEKTVRSAKVVGELRSAYITDILDMQRLKIYDEDF